MFSASSMSHNDSGRPRPLGLGHSVSPPSVCLEADPTWQAHHPAACPTTTHCHLSRHCTQWQASASHWPLQPHRQVLCHRLHGHLNLHHLQDDVVLDHPPTSAASSCESLQHGMHPDAMHVLQVLEFQDLAKFWIARTWKKTININFTKFPRLYIRSNWLWKPFNFMIL